MLRRAVLTLLFGAGIPILALSYMALRSISTESREDQLKARAQAQHAAEFLADRLNDQLEHIEGSLAGHVRDAVRAAPDSEEDPDPSEHSLNATGRLLVASLENLRRSESLVRHAFLASSGGGGRLLYPATHKAPAQREPEPGERAQAADAINRAEAERETDPNDADQTLYFAWAGCKDPGLKGALRLAQAELAQHRGFLEDARKLLSEVREQPDLRGIDEGPIYPAATFKYAEVVEKDSALSALLELVDALAEDRWNQEAGERRKLFDDAIGEAERLVEATSGPGPSEERRRLQARRARARFLEGFEDSILREVRAHVVYPPPGELTGPAFRLGSIVGDREPRLLSTIGVVASVTRDTAPVTSGDHGAEPRATSGPRPGHRNEPSGDRGAEPRASRVLVGVDIDFDRLRPWAEAEIAGIMSTTDSRIAVVEGGITFAGDPALKPGTALAEVAFAKELPGWHVLAAPRDPEGPERAARRKLTISLALVATCALAALGSFSLALRAASREVEVAKVRGDLVRNVSHELRTPVASIQMLSEMLEEGGLPPPKQEEYFGRIAREARRLSRLIENVLDLAKVERGARKVEPVPLALGASVAEAVLLFRESEQGREANVVFRDGSAGAIVPLDASTVEQIVGNLLSNAVKYSPPGAEVGVECAVDDPAGKAVIVVRDEGRGMTAEEVQRLFNPFYRARPEDAGATGVGLGLVITRELVRLHGGELGVTSAPGAGTAFTITLPRGPV